MARETKQDRTVRSIYDQVLEHLHEIKNIELNPASRETDVERWAQSFLRSCLGFTSSAGYSIRAQDTKSKMRPDLLVYSGEKPVVVVEVKKINFDLNKSDFRCGKVQLSEYLKTIGGVRWGVLTNGLEWRIYDFSQAQYGGFEIGGFNLKSEEEFDLSKKAVEEICYEILDSHETSFNADVWSELSREALAFSPESLTRAILSADVVKYIAKSIRGEHEYRANHEMLTDKLFQLLESGLDDSIPGWNEARHDEIQKYIRTQKRASRRAPKGKKQKTEAAEIVAEPNVGEAPAVNVELQTVKSEGAA